MTHQQSSARLRQLFPIGLVIAILGSTSSAFADDAPSPAPATPPLGTPEPSAPAQSAPAAPAPYYQTASTDPTRPVIYVAQPPLPPLDPRTRHYHDGFYLRLSVGFGGLGTTSSRSGSDGTSTISGGGGAFDLLIGGTPAPGLVIGGGLLSQDAFSPSVSDSALLPQRSASSFGLVMVGPFIDAFPNPSGGFHFGGLLGFAAIPGLKGSDNNVSGGGGLSVWAGYMAWASSEWSLGGLIRLSGAFTGRKIDGVTGRLDVTDATRAISFMFSAAYH